MPPNASVPGYTDSLDDVTCPTMASCVAVGNYDTSETQVGVIDTLADGTWTAEPGSLPENTSPAQYSSLTTVACATSRSCVAVGGYGDSGDSQEGLLEALAQTTPTMPSVISSSSVSSVIAFGQSNIDVAAVTGDATDGSPSGVVSVYACGPTAVPAPCTSFSDGVGAPLEVTSEPDDSATATSASFTPDAPGYWCFAAYYSGDSNYGSSTDTTTDVCFEVTQAIASTCRHPVSRPSLPVKATMTSQQ